MQVNANIAPPVPAMAWPTGESLEPAAMVVEGELKGKGES